MFSQVDVRLSESTFKRLIIFNIFTDVGDVFHWTVLDQTTPWGRKTFREEINKEHQPSLLYSATNFKSGILCSRISLQRLPIYPIYHY